MTILAEGCVHFTDADAWGVFAMMGGFALFPVGLAIAVRKAGYKP